jgi:cytochrome b pre-mRNA-processing protein 3
MVTFLKRIWPTAPHREAARTLYRKAVEQARVPAFYRTFGVPDTVDGRFDMIVIHTGLTVRRLRDAPENALPRTVAQEMFDYMIVDFDRSLREMGVGDLSVGKHIKKMGQAWYARAATYDRGIDEAAAGDAGALERALVETLFRATPDAGGAKAIAHYILRAEAHLKSQALTVLATGEIDWSIAVEETLP